MKRHLIKNIRPSVLLGISLLILTALPVTTHAWTSASLSEVHVTLDVAKEGMSRITTTARFEVSGGSFHGFDLAPLSGAELVESECSAVLDDGRDYPLSFRKLYDGRTRIVLADKGYIKRSGVNFSLVHEVDLVETGALRSHEGRARLDWTPIVWDEGTNQMSVAVNLPADSADAPLSVDSGVSRDYHVEADRAGVTFTKHRTVRWYPMQVVVDFDPSVVSSLGEDREEDREEAAAIANVSKPSNPVPPHISVLPVAAVLLGLLLLARKAWRTSRALEDLGIRPRFALLRNTGFATRLGLSSIAAGLGLGAQWYGSLTASILPLVIGAALWVIRREKGSIRPRPGGAWRHMDAIDLHRHKQLVRAYRARRRSFTDITTAAGVFTFLLVLAGIGYAVVISRGQWPRIGWAIAINSLILLVPAWFANVRSELPVDATLESFSALGRWRHPLARMLGSRAHCDEAAFWVREDDKGSIEVRLRAQPELEGLRGIEVAGEIVKSGTSVKCRRAIVLHMEPGTDAARKVATCPFAAEHHLTPDLQEEIIVLRNRRGRTSKGFAPLRSALALLHG